MEKPVNTENKRCHRSLFSIAILALIFFSSDYSAPTKLIIFTTGHKAIALTAIARSLLQEQKAVIRVNISPPRKLPNPLPTSIVPLGYILIKIYLVMISRYSAAKPKIKFSVAIATGANSYSSAFGLKTNLS